MKNLKTIIGLAAMALCLGFASCSSDDDAPSYSAAAVSNSELMTILKDKGYQFNEQGNLLLDDKATSTTSLDLSGTKISQKALAELNILPNLTDVNLSNNGYEDSFDFSNLPAQVTGIDLTGNEIKDYDNLVKVTIAENGNEIVDNLHNITKLYLPNEAKNNIAQLVRFYRQNKSLIDNGTIDVKMANASGNLEKYNTLREVPDDVLRSYLNQETTFSDLFDGDKIDVSKTLSNSEKINNIYINQYFVENFSNLQSLEGIQYIINNPYWEGTTIYISPNSTLALPKVEIGSSLTLLQLKNVDVTNGLDISKAAQLTNVNFNEVTGLKVLDLRSNTTWGQRGSSVEEDGLNGSALYCVDCPDLEEIYLPSNSNLGMKQLDIEVLPKLKVFDMSKISMVVSLAIGDLPESYKLVYPNLTIFNSASGKTTFACSTQINSLDSTVEFVKKYYKDVTDKKLNISVALSSTKNKAAFWFI